VIQAQRSLIKSNLLFVVALMLGGSLFAHSRLQEGRRAELQHIRTIQKFLRVLYPELMNHHYLMTVSTTGVFDSDWMGTPSFDVRIGRDPAHWESVSATSGSLPPKVYEKPTLSASFEFDPDGLFRNVHASTWTQEVKNHAMWKEVQANPEWSDKRVGQELEKAGAKFGPLERDAVIKAFPREALEPFIGAVTVESAEFRLRHQQKPKPLAEPYWVVVASSVTSSGVKVEWEMYFEPFEGRLTDLSRSPD
jgi:hypothetical protein